MTWYGQPLTPTDVEFDGGFVELIEEEQDFILQHEAGHIVAIRNKWPAHAWMINMYAIGIDLPIDFSSPEHFAMEVEADMYAAEQVGIHNAIRIMAFTLLDEKERQTRLRNLTAAWKKKYYGNTGT